MRRVQVLPTPAGNIILAPIPWGTALLLSVLLVVGGCQRDRARDSLAFPATKSGELTILYPLDETLFPPEIAAPIVRWTDTTVDIARWQVLLRVPGEEGLRAFDAPVQSWQPAREDWEEIKRYSVDTDVELAIVGIDERGQPASSDSIRLRTSVDPVGDSIFYREVPLPFIDAVQDPAKIRWRFGSVDMQDRPPVVLENLPVCGNCHSFSSSGDTLGIDVDYGNDKGGYAILPVQKEMILNDEKIITWSDYKKDDGEATFGLLSQVSPDGRYVISTVKDRAVFVATPGIEFSQLFFPIKGILVVYDTVTDSYEPLPGADDPEYVQSNPTWSPDGKSVVFARSKVYRKESIESATAILLDENDVPEFIEDQEPFKFDLYRVPFNEGRGGQAVPIEGASHNGRSNFFAKFSPDGKWIVFTQAENYMLLMPDSELFIIPAAGGEPRRLRANTPLMNSWHSFSSNGRWLVFSSKAYTPYTQLFLTHIDDEGNSTPPVVLDRFTEPDRAANIPEFVPLPADSIALIEERFLDAYSFLRAGMANERTGNYPAAVKAYERGLESDPRNVELLNAKGFALFQQGMSEKAVSILEQAVAVDPGHAKAHNNLALASIDIGELELAEAHYRESLSIDPQPQIYNDLGFVLELQGLPFEAATAYRMSLELDPGAARTHRNLATVLAQSGEWADAESQFLKALEIESNAQAYAGLGLAQWRLGRIDEGIASTREAVSADSKYAVAFDQLGTMLVEKGQLEEAISIYRDLANAHPSVVTYTKLADVLNRAGESEEADEAKQLARRLTDEQGKTR